MQKHLDEFKEQGYTVFEGLFDRETIAQWKAVFYDLIERQPAMERKRAPEVPRIGASPTSGWPRCDR